MHSNFISLFYTAFAQTLIFNEKITHLHSRKKATAEHNIFWKILLSTKQGIGSPAIFAWWQMAQSADSYILECLSTADSSQTIIVDYFLVFTRSV